MASAYEASVTDAAAKYFYFISLNERLSFSASLKVLAELKSQNRLDREHRGHWVQTLHKWRSKLAALKPRTWTESPSEKGFLFPDHVDLAGWTSFAHTANFDEVEAVLLSRILGFSDVEISQGLGVTVGTVRYRVGRGLRHLGGYIES
jgi:hypothetical protein